MSGVRIDPDGRLDRLEAPIREAVAALIRDVFGHAATSRSIAPHMGMESKTVDRLLYPKAGGPTLPVRTLLRAADVLGYDVKVSFVRRPK